MTLEDGKGARLVLTTVARADDAQSLARGAVEAGLAACVSILPQVRSVYRWKGEIEEDSEILVLLKTTVECLVPLEQSFGELHPYDVPEFLVFDVSAGSNAYLAWLISSVDVTS